MFVRKRSWMAAVVVIGIGALVVSAGLRAQDGEPARPTILPDPPSAAAPPPEMTEAQLHQLRAAAAARWRDHVPTVQGKVLALPEDAEIDTLVARTSRPRPEGDLRPIPLPIYLIIRDGEVADVSKTTGEFMIGEGHEETFQFLIDQLGRDKMQVVPTDIYERRWGPFRDNWQ